MIMKHYFSGTKEQLELQNSLSMVLFDDIIETKMNKRKMEGEVRRIHIIYFLSRKGRIEHPHLIRVHHVSQNGVHLSDVKRWLAELRGKEVTESFAWSYKRRYRTGYVWQDLVDEDLITPISDNEYVLKGSQIFSNHFTNTTEVNAEEKAYMEKESIEREEIGLDQNVSLEEAQQHQQTTIYLSPKTSPVFSPEVSTPNLNSIYIDEEKKLLETTNEPNVETSEIYSSYLSKTRLNKKNEKKNDSGNSKISFNMVRKLFNCRTVETSDATTVKLNKRKCDKYFCTTGKNMVQDNMGEISKEEDNSGGSDVVLLSSWKQQRCPSARRSVYGVKRSNSTRSQGKSPKPHRPINGPNCSQCGKMFKPEKMHEHMRSCSGRRRSFGKGSGVFAAATQQIPIMASQADQWIARLLEN